MYMGIAPLKIMELYQFMMRFASTAFDRPVRTEGGLGSHLFSFQQLPEGQERSQEMGCTRGVTEFICSVQLCAEETPKGAVTELAETPRANSHNLPTPR